MQANSGKKGVAKAADDTYVKGTKVVKKSNFRDHLTKSFPHATAVWRLSDDIAKSNDSSQDKQKENTLASTTGLPKQTIITPFVQ